MPDLENFKNWGTDNLTGLVAIVAGLILVALTYQIIISLLVFSAGLILIYFGALKLRIKQLRDLMRSTGEKIKDLFSQQNENE
jgi:hypothetical protein